MLVSITQLSVCAIDDAWGDIGLTHDALRPDASAGTVFNKYTSEAFNTCWPTSLL